MQYKGLYLVDSIMQDDLRELSRKKVGTAYAWRVVVDFIGTKDER